MSRRGTAVALAALLVVSLLTGGCAELIFGAFGIVSGGVNMYQQYEARQARKEQTEEIKRLREEIERGRSVVPQGPQAVPEGAAR